MTQEQINEIKSKIRIDFGTPDIYVDSNNYNRIPTLYVGSPIWHGTDFVQQLDIHIEGINPLTGESVSKLFGSISASVKNIHKTVERLNGDYIVHLNALCYDGTGIRDVLNPVPVHINSERAVPYVSWQTANAGNGWTKLSINTNCPQRIMGKMWLKGERYQKVPDFSGNSYVCYVPFDCSKAVITVKDGKDIRVKRT